MACRRAAFPLITKSEVIQINSTDVTEVFYLEYFCDNIKINVL
jgi:hypothetical protein